MIWTITINAIIEYDGSINLIFVETIVGSVSRNGDRVQIEIILCKMIKKSEPGY